LSAIEALAIVGVCILTCVSLSAFAFAASRSRSV